jgi:hypothetical protein
MKQVSKKAFFATVGRLDVHPCPEGRYDNVKGYRSLWKMHGTADVIGETIGGTIHMETQFFVTGEFYQKHLTAIAAGQ